MAPLCFGSGVPTRVAAAGVKDKGTGVDLAAGITLEYEGQGESSRHHNEASPSSVERGGALHVLVLCSLCAPVLWT